MSRFTLRTQRTHADGALSLHCQTYPDRRTAAVARRRTAADLRARGWHVSFPAPDLVVARRGEECVSLRLGEHAGLDGAGNIGRLDRDEAEL